MDLFNFIDRWGELTKAEKKAAKYRVYELRDFSEVSSVQEARLVFIEYLIENDRIQQLPQSERVGLANQPTLAQIREYNNQLKAQEDAKVEKERIHFAFFQDSRSFSPHENDLILKALGSAPGDESTEKKAKDVIDMFPELSTFGVAKIKERVKVILKRLKEFDHLQSLK